MKRKDIISALLKPTIASDAAAQPESKPVRVAAGSVRAMGLELGRLTEEAGQADVLRGQLASGSIVVELDPDEIEPSFVADRLGPTSDPQYRQLVESIRRDGQKIPILVRPLADKGHDYQIAYGHRRWHAARELGIRVRAIVQQLSDTELVIAQGKENSERRNLSFIERALFAANLNSRGFDRPTINAALAVQSAETTRLLAVAAAIPPQIVGAIGPAPKAGRTRWMELVDYLGKHDMAHLVSHAIEQPSFQNFGTDARFESLMATLRAAASKPLHAEQFTNIQGQPVVKVTRSGQGLRLWIDEHLASGLGAYLIRSLPGLILQFEHDTDKQRAAD
jgi:ParB family chromosome partitioning protein